MSNYETRPSPLAPTDRGSLARELGLIIADDEAKLRALRTAINEGDLAQARGDGDEVRLDGVRSHLAGLGRRA